MMILIYSRKAAYRLRDLSGMSPGAPKRACTQVQLSSVQHNTPQYSSVAVQRHVTLTIALHCIPQYSTGIAGQCCGKARDYCTRVTIRTVNRVHRLPSCLWAHKMSSHGLNPCCLLPTINSMRRYSNARLATVLFPAPLPPLTGNANK